MKYSFLAFVLRVLARRTLSRYHPVIVGITGSVGKTSTKEAIFAVLRRSFQVTKNTDNFNNELGVPMTVLGITPAGSREHKATMKTRLRLFKGIAQAVWLASGPKKVRFPKIFVLELGADKPKDIAYLSELLKPQIAVITAIGKIPVHVEFYPSAQAVAKEKSNILAYLGSQGLAILNQDDDVVLGMKEKVRGDLMTFGLNKSADIWASNLAYYLDDTQLYIEGISFKIHRGENFIPVRLKGIVATHQIYALLAAVAVGIRFGMNLVEITNAFESIEFPAQRMSLIKGVNNTTIIDDTYNASPLSMRAALETLRDVGATFQKLQLPRRKIAILGDMKELGIYAVDAHKEIGVFAESVADSVITVGELGKYISEKNWFPTLEDAIAKIMEFIHDGDVILVKGSRAMKMEKIVDALRQK